MLQVMTDEEVAEHDKQVRAAWHALPRAIQEHACAIQTWLASLDAEDGVSGRYGYGERRSTAADCIRWFVIESEPPSWWEGDTLVYRSHADYLDD